MDHSDSWDNRLDPVENGLSNYIRAPCDGNISCRSAASDQGEPSSSGHNLQERICNHDLKLRLSSLNDSMSQDWSFGPSDMQNYSLNHGSMNLSSNYGHVKAVGPPHALCKPSRSGKEHIPTFHVSSTNVGTSSGPSCKRKPLEGTSGDLNHSGISILNQPMENINTSTSSGSLNLAYTNPLEQLNPRNGFGTSRVSPCFFFASSSVLGIAALRSNLGQHESVPLDMPRATSVRQSSVNVVSDSYASELMSPMAMSMNPENTLNRPSIPEARETHAYPWNGSFSSRVSGSARGSEAQEEANTRSSFQNNPEYPITAPETRNVLQEQTKRSFTPPAPTSSRNYYSSSEIGSSSRGQPSSPTWLPRRNQASRNHQRSSEAAPWICPPQMESEAQIRRSPFVLFPMALTSLDETAAASHGRHHLDQRSAAFLMDMTGDDIHGWNGLAAVKGRHRLIRQVLNAVRRAGRGDHLRVEDYVLIDPLVDAFSELQDQHRDLRLDVDNMSYEELLALEERMGNVSTGLSEEKIRGSVKQRKYEAAVKMVPNLEPCCICQEDYVSGDDIGTLDYCGHEFHSKCIEQWLKLKNMCPTCKMMALET